MENTFGMDNAFGPQYDDESFYDEGDYFEDDEEDFPTSFYSEEVEDLDDDFYLEDDDFYYFEDFENYGYRENS